MGLDTTHGCWGGPYGAFARFRIRVAHAVGEPTTNESDIRELDLWYRDEFADSKGLMGDWPENEPADPIYVLLCHSDCEGVIEHRHTLPLAVRLEGICESLVSGVSAADMFADDLEQFAAGLRKAHEAGEDVGFF